MKGCSLNVQRHLTVNRTVVRGPSVLVLSRPVGNLSGGKMRRVEKLFRRVGGRKGLVVLTDRGERSVSILYSRMCRVRGNVLGGQEWLGSVIKN